MKVNIVSQKVTTFRDLNLGEIFKCDSGIYIKSNSDSAVCIVKKSSEEPGECYAFTEEVHCYPVVEVTFVL